MFLWQGFHRVVHINPFIISYKIVNVTQKSLYVRYIEALLCQWPTTPTRRYSEDLLARANGSVASFFKETDLACSLALAVHIVYTPNTLAIFVDPGGALGSQTIKVDLLAFLFGLNNIPNSQTGGFNVSSSSRDEAKEEFREGTNQSL
ncbi:unnamed protein product [Mucor hiemalis]